MLPNKRISFTIEGDLTKTEIGIGTYRMEFDYNNLCEAENLTGTNLVAFSGRMSASQTRAHVFAALRKHHPQIELREVGNLLTKDRETVLDALGALYEQSNKDAGAVAE